MKTMQFKYSLFLLLLLPAFALTAEDSRRLPFCPGPSVYETMNRKWLKTMKKQAETPGLVRKALAGPLRDVQEIVFAVRQRGPGHFYETFGHDFRLPESFSHSPGGGRLCRLDLRTGEVRVIIDDPEGALRDPRISYDADRILFAWRKSGKDLYHIYETSIDGSSTRQITDGENGRFDDVEPVYLPDGDIMFVSSRARRGVPCWTTQVGLCFRCGPDGADVRMVSNGIEHEISPWVLPDGRIVYTRWEYVNRSATAFHHLWTFNPDGTAAMAFYGNQHPGFAITEAKNIPGTRNVLAVFGSGHGNNEREGFLAVIDPRAGPDDKEAAPIVCTGYPEHVKDPECWRDPHPLDREFFLVACEDRIYIMNNRGEFETLYKLGDSLKVSPRGPWKTWVHEPCVLQPRRREPVIPDRVDYDRENGLLILQNVKVSRDQRVESTGTAIEKLLMVEVLPMPVSMSWTADSAFVTNSSYNVKRILGTVPVYEDGSAYMEVPAMRPVYFVALDKNNRPVKSMDSFTSVMPGETASCVGCHENRTLAPERITRGTLMALKQDPDKVRSVPEMPPRGIFHFPRDIQPIFSKHCVKCHNYNKFAGDIVLTEDRGVRFYNSLAFLKEKNIEGDKLINILRMGHHKVALSDSEINTLNWWSMLRMPFSGTYASFGTAGDECDLPYSHPEGPKGQENPDAVALDFNESVLAERCHKCHVKGERKQKTHSKYTGRGWPRARGYDYMFNMTSPEKSLLLLAPLSKESGGLGLCRQKDARSKLRKKAPGKSPDTPPAEVFKSTNDPDYKALLAELRRMSGHLSERKTFPHAEKWRPVGDYIRTMKLYGVLPRDFDFNRTPLNPFGIDTAYYNIFYDGRTGNEKPLYSGE